jgi:ABC-type Fe3+-hydroxamate transport system substrate-binding protein
MTEVVLNTTTQEGYNAYQRKYYNNIVNKENRKQQFAAYYQKNKEKINARSKAKRDAKKLFVVGIEPTAV